MTRDIRSKVNTFDTLFALEPGPPPFPLPQGSIDSDIVHPRGYVYANINIPETVTWTLGLSVDSYEDEARDVQETFDKFQVNPKFGVQWNVTDNFRLRGAVFNAVKPIIVANRTLEPTQIAGFNQMFDYPNATEVFQYGIGTDWDVTNNLHLGAEAIWRDLEAPNMTQLDLDFDGVIDSRDFRTEDQDEQLYRAYIYWLPIPELALSAEFAFDRFESESGGLTEFSSTPLELETFSVPLGVRYFHPSGFFAGLGGTYVHQEVDRSDTAALFGFSEGTDDFFILDAAVGWRFPNRIGIASLSVSNLLDEEFLYQDDSFREFRDEPTAGPYFPDRTIIGRVTLNF